MKTNRRNKIAKTHQKHTKTNNNTSSSSIKNTHVNILSWNIQASNTVSGNKFEDSSFINLIKNHDILCLQEIRQRVKIEGYRSFCNIRADERSGGVGIFFKNEYLGGIELVNYHSIADTIICKLKKSFFKVNQDIYIINTYIKPSNSSIKTNNINGRDILKQIEDLTNELQSKGDIILCGDFNSRISNHPGLINHEHDRLNDFVPLPDDYIPDNFSNRQTRDEKSNSLGKDLLSLVINNRLLILNGRTLGDLKGDFTCLQYNGCSVVDYFITSHNLTKMVEYMKILEFSPFSDHKRLSLKLTFSFVKPPLRTPIDKSFDKAPTRFLFDEDSKTKFLNIQNDPRFLQRRNDLNSNLDYNSCQSMAEFNDKYTLYLRDMGYSCLKSTTNSINKKKNNPWFNFQCNSAKRELNKAARVVSKFPSSDFLRKNYYKVKKTYKKLIKRTKINYFDKLNNDIERGRVLNWQQFKRLKSLKSEKNKFDSLDMEIFQTFFTDLYSDSHKTISTETKNDLINKADNLNNNSPTLHSPILNKTITEQEVMSSISTLKLGKASSTDMISNEIIKSLDKSNVSLLTKLYNNCLDSGSYPWNTSIITPIHKKGSKDDPDNYRAVSVSSIIGKLFSTILLGRLIEFRKKHCPDPPNQLGFTKDAQTYDHIITMRTIISKYKKLKKKVFAVFVDFRKAFDSVCRQALFYKMAANGITGKFYNVLRNMYSASSSQIKLCGHLSNKFAINNGTEQGHPLSPDLFKLFLSDLSPALEFKDCPILSGILISHLLWADDLILLTLSDKTLQLQLDRLTKFCSQWGIEINVKKTKLVIFNEKESDMQSRSFILNGRPLESTDSYCYLGIILHKSGKFSLATDDLKNKATRALFSLKRSVDRSKLSFRALTILFDSLIKPIVLYGAPIWTPGLPIIKHIASSFLSQPPTLENLCSKISKTQCEKVHLNFLKWALGTHRKASNVGIWGESGRFPLIYQSLKLTLNYFKRLENLNNNSFVFAAFQEQKNLKLPWFQNIETLMRVDATYDQDHVTAKTNLSIKTNKVSNFLIHNGFVSIPKNYKSGCIFSETSGLKLAQPLRSGIFDTVTIYNSLIDHFKLCWHREKSISSKLSYYHTIKTDFAREHYLHDIINFQNRSSLTKLRISAHDLCIEEGRYNNIPRYQRICKWCMLTTKTANVEDEIHVLNECDLYAKHRAKLTNQVNSMQPSSSINQVAATAPINDLITLLLTNQQEKGGYHICNAIGNFITKCFQTRWKFKKNYRDSHKPP